MLKMLLVLFSICVAGQVSAQPNYPSKPVRLIVPFAAGGPTDAIGRILGQELGTQLKQPFIVDNRPGATGMIGQDLVSKSTPDGYTLVMITSTSSNGYHLLHRKIGRFDAPQNLVHEGRRVPEISCQVSAVA